MTRESYVGILRSVPGVRELPATAESIAARVGMTTERVRPVLEALLKNGHIQEVQPTESNPGVRYELSATGWGQLLREAIHGAEQEQE